MPIVRCPNCDDALDVDTRELGTTVQCDACDHEFRAKRSRRDDEDDEEDRRPRNRQTSLSGQREKEKKDNRTVLIVLVILCVVLGLPCLGCLGFIIYTNTAKVGFTAQWVDQSLNAQDGTTIAMSGFPANPVLQSFTDANGNGLGRRLAISTTPM
jgi:cytoskeletal protein RodZ